MRIHLAPDDPNAPGGDMSIKSAAVKLGTTAALGKSASGGITLGSGTAQYGSSGAFYCVFFFAYFETVFVLLFPVLFSFLIFS